MTKVQVFAKLTRLGYGVVENIVCSWTGKKVRFQTYSLGTNEIVAGGGGAQSFPTLDALNRYADQVIETRTILGYI
jgi:hypothetical protein